MKLTISEKLHRPRTASLPSLAPHRHGISTKAVQLHFAVDLGKLCRQRRTLNFHHFRTSNNKLTSKEHQPVTADSVKWKHSADDTAVDMAKSRDCC
jgi:hypothetical protein